LSRGDSSRAQGLRQDYALFLSRQLQMEDVGAAVGAVRDFFLPQSAPVAVMAQPEAPDEQADEDEPAGQEAPDAQPSKEADAPQDADAGSVSAKSLQTSGEAAAPQTKALSADGDDTSAGQGERNASLSPSAVTVPITRPVEGGRYSSYFGYRNNPITHQNAFHTGLDIAVPLGTKIRAAYGGTVRQVGEDSRSGKYVTITHDDGYETFYCHCSRILVPNGTVVRAGEAVACVGSTGWSTGPHLHFEIRKNGARLDPLQILEHDV
ncbi:MAG: peptidoglycan DD-metalloendopeptidase family protein, partial [Clostridia bacterium]|nr:peptidoglycan DD-metalloendopeptidase family protein [Clostridia bacterium]